MKTKKIVLFMLTLLLGCTMFVLTGAASPTYVTTTYSASADFSGTQGAKQWYYQKLSGSTYSDLIYDSKTKHWEQSASDYPWISADAQHPDKNFDAVRKWVSPGTGTITITGDVRKGDSKGDGILATIKKDGTKLWSAVVKKTTSVNPAGVANIPVVKGTAIYFIVNSQSSMSNDHTLWNPTILYKTEEIKPVSDQVQSAPSNTPPASSDISILSCGATPNDDKDDYAAIVACIDKAKTQGKAVYAPPGNYLLSKILTLDSVSLYGAGPDLTTLTSTDPNKGSIDLKGTAPKLSHLKHTYSTVVPRGNGANEKNNITVRGATQFVIDDVYVYKASTAGILVQGVASNGKITNNRVEATNADGIHITDGSHTIAIENNVVKAVGDDTIAVVSYMQDGVVSHNITIRNNDVGYDSLARGITVVGGTDVLIEGNSVKDTQMAGIYIAVEGSYNTSNVDRITVNGNTVEHTGIREPANHPNVLVYASQGQVDNVVFNNNMIKNAAHRGIGVWGSGTIKNVTFNNNTLINLVGASTVFSNGIIKLNGNTGF